MEESVSWLGDVVLSERLHYVAWNHWGPLGNKRWKVHRRQVFGTKIPLCRERSISFHIFHRWPWKWEVEPAYTQHCCGTLDVDRKMKRHVRKISGRSVKRPGKNKTYIAVIATLTTSTNLLLFSSRQFPSWRLNRTEKHGERARRRHKAVRLGFSIFPSRWLNTH